MKRMGSDVGDAGPSEVLLDETLASQVGRQDGLFGALAGRALTELHPPSPHLSHHELSLPLTRPPDLPQL